MQQDIGPYRVVERLGAGGMGEVFLAEDTRLGRKVALKALTDTSLAAPEARARILREAAAAATINHPNVAAVYDVLEDHARAHIVMEYVPGETLAEQLRQGPLPIDRVVQVGLQLCDALTAAHASGVIHRDLKPANVRVTPEGRAKVLDFGLAHRPELAPVSPGHPADEVVRSLAAAGQLLGTPVYMAPEVLLGHDADIRSDVYSLGVTLFEVTTGRPPFEGRNFVSVAMAVLSDPPPPVADIIPGGLGKIVAKAMARDPKERYQTAAQLRRDLDSLSAELKDLPTGVLKLPPRAIDRPSRVPLSSRSRRWLVGTSVALVLLLGLVTSAVWQRGSAAAPAPIIAVWPMETIADDDRAASLGYGVASLLQGALANRLGQYTVVSGSGTATDRRDVRALAGDVGASYAVPVTVHVHQDEVLVDAQLVRASTGAVIGSVTERTLRSAPEFFDVPDRVAERLVALLGVTPGREASSSSPTTAAASVPEPSARPPMDDFTVYSQALALLGRRYVPGNVDEAIGLLEGVVARNPTFAPAHAALSEAWSVQFMETRAAEAADRAVASAERAFALDAGDPGSVLALARSYETVGRGPEAIGALREALRHRPRNDDLHRMLGEILVAGGASQEGFAALREAVDIRPDYAENQSALGVSLYREGRHREALEPLGRAAALQPTSPLVHQRLGAAFHQLGQSEQALTEYARAAALGGSPAVYSNMGTILYYLGRYEEALVNYEASLERRPGSETTWRSKGDTLLKLGRAAEARAAYQRAAALAETVLQTDPGDARIRGFLAVCRAKLGENDRARALAAEALEQAPEDHQVMYRGAVVNALTGHLDEARVLLQRAIDAGYSPAAAAEDDDLAALRPLTNLQATP